MGIYRRPAVRHEQLHHSHGPSCSNNETIFEEASE